MKVTKIELYCKTCNRNYKKWNKINEKTQLSEMKYIELTDE